MALQSINVGGAINDGTGDIGPRAWLQKYNANFIELYGGTAAAVHLFNLKSFGALGNGTADDTAAMLSWIAAAAGGVAFVPPGTYLINPANITYLAPGTLLWMAPGATFKLAANAQISLTGGLYYIFAASLGSSYGSGDFVTLDNFTFDGNRLNQTKKITAFLFYKVKAPTLNSPYVINCTGEAFVCTDTPNLTIYNPYISQCGRTGNSGTARPGIAVVGDVALADPWHPYNQRIIGGYVEYSGLDGIIFNGTDASIYGVTSNYNGVDVPAPLGAAGIFYTSNAAAATIRNITIDSCTCIGNTGHGIDTAPNASPLVGIRIINCECSLNNFAGIQADATSYAWIENNRCYDNAQSGTALLKGGIILSVNFAVDRAYIRRNVSKNIAGTTQKWGLQLGATAASALTNLIVMDNDFSGNQTGGIGTEYGSQPLQFVTGGYGSFARNTGYSPTFTALTNAGTQLAYTASLETLTMAGPTNLLGISTGNVEDLCTIVFGNANTTCKASGGNFVLRDAIDVKPPNNATMTFQFDGTFWREIGRTSIPDATGVLFQDAGKTTTSTSDVSLSSFALPAGLLGVNGQSVRLIMRGVAVTQNAIPNIKFGATVVVTGTVTAANNYEIEVLVTRTGATTQIAIGTLQQGGAITSTTRSSPAETLANAITVDFRGSVTSGGTLAGDIISVEYLAA